MLLNFKEIHRKHASILKEFITHCGQHLLQFWGNFGHTIIHYLENYCPISNAVQQCAFKNRTRPRERDTILEKFLPYIIYFILNKKGVNLITMDIELIVNMGIYIHYTRYLTIIYFKFTVLTVDARSRIYLISKNTPRLLFTSREVVNKIQVK